MSADESMEVMWSDKENFTYEIPSRTVMTFYQDEPPAGWEVVPNAIGCRKL